MRRDALASDLTSCALGCAGTCRYPGAEIQFVGFQYSGASGPLPGIPYSALADDEGNVRVLFLATAADHAVSCAVA